MRYNFQTDGERLAEFVGRRLIRDAPWEKLSQSLINTGRNEQLCAFFQEVTVVNVACRIVAAGTSLLNETDQRPGRDPSDPTFEKEFRDFLRERLLVAPPLSDELFRAAVRAVQATCERVTEKVRARHKARARKRFEQCYMCGTSMDFQEQDPHTKFTLEHIWPRRYGGNSIDENLLPACGACNSHKKKDFASWAMTSVQSLVLGFAPSENEFTSIDGSLRFALHYFAARRFATARQTDLKSAFSHLGPWREFRLKDASDIADFFNLENHRSLVELQ